MATALYESPRPAISCPVKPMHYRYTFEALDFKKRLLHYISNWLTGDMERNGYKRTLTMDLEIARFASEMERMFSIHQDNCFTETVDCLSRLYWQFSRDASKENALRAGMVNLTRQQCFSSPYPANYMRYNLLVYVPSTDTTHAVEMHCTSLEEAFDQTIDAYVNIPRHDDDVPIYEHRWKIESLRDPTGAEHNLELEQTAGDLFDMDAMLIRVHAPIDFTPIDFTDPGKAETWTIKCNPPEPSTIGSWH